MNRWCGLLLPGLFLATQLALTGQNLESTARDLARQVAAAAGTREAVLLTARKLSVGGAEELDGIRLAFEAELRSQGMRLTDRPGAPEVRLTLSQNLTSYLLVAELGRAEERHVLMAAAPRQLSAVPAVPAPTMVLEKKLVWEQEQPILDLTLTAPSGAPPGLLILDPAKVALYAERGGHWEEQQSQPVVLSRSWPRDPRGRLLLNGNAFQAYLPGTLCRGVIQPSLTMECHESADGWPLEAGTRLLGLAGLAAGANYFDGRVVTAPGGARHLPPFYSGAAVEDQGGPLWFFAALDGRTYLYNSAWEPAGTVDQWGSDLAGLEPACGLGGPVLAVRPGDFSEPDAVQAFTLVNRSAVPASAPVAFPGPVTALWPAGRSSAIAVAQEPDTRHYAAFRLLLACGS
ncbi:MAG TPA: hypothetical protein VFA33_04395 [Bryobacteraceae bacterium]|nr:hypothetical protein [Bryobacteraceae bacterium]